MLILTADVLNCTTVLQFPYVKILNLPLFVLFIRINGNNLSHFFVIIIISNISINYMY